MEVVGGNILDEEHLDNLVEALAGNGSGGGKAKGGGLRISVMLFCHEHDICLRIIVVHKGRIKKKRLDKAIPSATKGDDPSWISPPPLGGQGGWRMEPA